MKRQFKTHEQLLASGWEVGLSQSVYSLNQKDPVINSNMTRQLGGFIDIQIVLKDYRRIMMWDGWHITEEMLVPKASRVLLPNFL